MVDYYGGLHLLLRFSDKITDIDDTIEAHNKIVDTHGNVWFGKLGKTLGYERIERINVQIGDNVPSALLLVQKIKGKHKLYCSEIFKIQKIKPQESEIQLIPDYYNKNNLLGQIKLWIKTSKMKHVDVEILKEFKIASSGFYAFDSLCKSMAPMFVLKTDYFQPLKDILKKHPPIG